MWSRIGGGSVEKVVGWRVRGHGGRRHSYHESKNVPCENNPGSKNVCDVTMVYDDTRLVGVMVTSVEDNAVLCNKMACDEADMGVIWVSGGSDTNAAGRKCGGGEWVGVILGRVVNAV